MKNKRGCTVIITQLGILIDISCIVKKLLALLSLRHCIILVLGTSIEISRAQFSVMLQMPCMCLLSRTGADILKSCSVHGRSILINVLNRCVRVVVRSCQIFRNSYFITKLSVFIYR
jgi:hypothetical protein